MQNNKIRKLNYAQAINETMFCAMEQDKSVICFGLGVDDPKGIFGTTFDSISEIIIIMIKKIFKLLTKQERKRLCMLFGVWDVVLRPRLPWDTEYIEGDTIFSI